MRRSAPVIAAVLALLAPAAVATPRTSLSDVEDEVMCPICGTLLELSNAPQAERERAFIERLIAQGRSKAEIKDALVREYGRNVLAQPQGRGFDLVAWLVPGGAILAAAVGLVLGVRRWRRSGPDEAERLPPGAPAEAERLETDRARYEL